MADGRPDQTPPIEAGADDADVNLRRRPYRRDRIRRRRRRSRSRKCNPGHSGSEVEEGNAEFHPHHAKDVPREVDLNSAFSTDVSAADCQDVTTVMLRHIPCRYMQSTLLREIDQMGFEGTYNFFYLPMDVRNKTSVGYCFINFMEPSHASRFSDLFGAYEFQRHRNEKIGEVSPAKIQGLWQNIRHFSGSAVLNARDSKRRPIVLQNGFRRDFGEVLAELEKGPEACRSRISAPLNPLAEEFVPRVVAAASHLDACSPSLPEAVDIHKAVAPVVEPPAAVLEDPDKAFKDARLQLDLVLKSFLGKASCATKASSQQPPSHAEAISTLKNDLQAIKELDNTSDVSDESQTSRFTSSNWVDTAFERLVDDLRFQAKSSKKENGFGGGWIGDALMVLAGNPGGGASKRWPSSLEQPFQSPLSRSPAEGSWVADAFSLLAVDFTKPMGKILLEDSLPGTPILTPRDALQRLRGLGGWAWVAFS